VLRAPQARPASACPISCTRIDTKPASTNNARASIVSFVFATIPPGEINTNDTQNHGWT